MDETHTVIVPEILPLAVAGGLAVAAAVAAVVILWRRDRRRKG